MVIPPLSLICLMASSMPSFWYCPGLPSRPLIGMTTPRMIESPACAAAGITAANNATHPATSNNAALQRRQPNHTEFLIISPPSQDLSSQRFLVARMIRLSNRYKQVLSRIVTTRGVRESMLRLLEHQLCQELLESRSAPSAHLGSALVR